MLVHLLQVAVSVDNYSIYFVPENASFLLSGQIVNKALKEPSNKQQQNEWTY